MPDRPTRPAAHRCIGSTRAVTDVIINGRTVRLTNLNKVLWPRVSLTKACLISYYQRIAPVILRHIAEHPLTLHSFPDGVERADLFETRGPAHPPWLRHQPI